MSEAVTAPAAQAPAPPSKAVPGKKGKGRLRRSFQSAFATLGWLGFGLKWMYPLFLMGIAYSLPHILRGVNKLSILPYGYELDPTRDTVIGTIGFAVVGLLVQNWVAGNQNASLLELIADALISGWWAIGTGVLATWAYMSGHTEFYLMFPAFYSALEMSWGLFAGLRNAYQRVPYDARMSVR
jgi:hypothetical protein